MTIAIYPAPISYKLDRFARDTHVYLGLRLLLHQLDVRGRSATEPIDDSSVGRLMETILAGFAQYDNESRGERTADGLRRAKEKGIKVPTLGKKYSRDIFEKLNTKQELSFAKFF